MITYGILYSNSNGNATFSTPHLFAGNAPWCVKGIDDSCAHKIRINQREMTGRLLVTACSLRLSLRANFDVIFLASNGFDGWDLNVIYLKD